jgi:hypothetical protein
MLDEDNGPSGVVKKFFWSPRHTRFFSDRSVVLPLSAVCGLKFKRLNALSPVCLRMNAIRKFAEFFREPPATDVVKRPAILAGMVIAVVHLDHCL